MAITQHTSHVRTYLEHEDGTRDLLSEGTITVALDDQDLVGSMRDLFATPAACPACGACPSWPTVLP